MSGSNKLALQVAEKFRTATGTAFCPTCSCHKPLDQFSRPKLPGKPRRCDSCHADAKARRFGVKGQAMSSKIIEALEIGLSFAMQESMARHGGPVSRSVALIEAALAEARAAQAAEPVAWMLRNVHTGEVYWDSESCVFGDSSSASDRAECENDDSEQIQWEAAPLVWGDTAPPPVAKAAEPVAWQPIETAPKDGTVVLGKFADGETDSVRWQDARQCMLAFVAKGAGECGPGWAAEGGGWLPVDPPTHWAYQDTAPPPVEASQQQASGEPAELAAWLRENSSGIYRKCSTAADLLEKQSEELSRLTAERDALRRLLDGVPQDAIDGGWTARGMSQYCKRIEADLSAAKAEAEALREVVRCLRAIVPDERWADDAKRMADAAIAAQQGEKE